MDISLADAKEYRAENKMRRWDSGIAAQMRSMQELSGAKCRKWVRGVFPVEAWRLILDLIWDYKGSDEPTARKWAQGILETRGWKQRWILRLVHSLDPGGECFAQEFGVTVT